MDENGIKMKAHFQIMKICGGRLGSWGGCWGADQINIEIYVCLAQAQTIPMCYFHHGGQSGKHNKNLNSVWAGKVERQCYFFFFFQLTVFILSDVGRQKEVAEAHNAAIQEQGRDCAADIKHAHLWEFVCGVQRLNIFNLHLMLKGRWEHVCILTCAYSHICIDFERRTTHLYPKKKKERKWHT